MSSRVARRAFLRGATASVFFPSIVSAAALGRDGATAASDRIVMASIGHGPRCRDVIRFFLMFDDVRFVAVCDARDDRLLPGKAQVDERYGNKDCKAYRDMHEVLARKDIDAVLIATGDRMHAVGSIYAARAGKDVYSEKPMSLTIGEGQALVETCRRLGTVYQCGHQRRSVDSYRFQAEVAQNGMIGKVHTVICSMWENPVIPPQGPTPVPPGVDYDAWLGATPWHPFIPQRFHNWRLFWDTAGGVLVDMGCHYTDLAQMGLNTDHTGPVRYDGRGEFAKENFGDVPVRAEIDCTYADGTKLILRSRGAFEDRFIRFEGTEGWIQVDDHTNVVTAEPKSILKLRGISARSWANPGDHIRNFLDSIRSRRETICPPLTAHRATVIGHAANLSMRLGRPLEWDPAAERFISDEEANRMIHRAMRAPWRL